MADTYFWRSVVFPIAHRIVSLNASRELPPSVGIEFDVHAFKDELIVVHDAFVGGLNLDEFLCLNKERFLAINVKEEGIEERIIEKANSYNIERFFLFDVSFPQCFRLGKDFHEHICIRMSQLEKPALEECKKISSYLWIDTFDGTFWMKDEEIELTKALIYSSSLNSHEYS